MADTRLPATGRTPLSPSAMQAAMNRAALIDWQARILLLNLPAQIGRHNVTYPPPPGTLPERPLAGPVAIGIENVVLGEVALAATLGYRRALDVLNAARKLTIYSGHPGLDAGFWVAYLRSPEIQRLVSQASAEVLTIPLPVESPIRASGLLQQRLYGFATQEELNQLFVFGQFGDLAAVNAKLDQLRSNRFYNIFPDEPNSQAAGLRQRVAVIEAGVQLRPIHDLRQAVAQLRYDAIRALLPLLFQEPPAFEQQGLPALPAKSSDP